MVRVTCAIILKNHKILVTQRGEKMKLPLKWEFPGGKLEIDESEENCIKREIREELGIEIGVIGRLSNNIHDYGSFKIELIPFLANYISGEIKLIEHANCVWLNNNELIDLDWAEADKPIVNELIKLRI
jgi:8-oxo-dGTP diphosphatase